MAHTWLIQQFVLHIQSPKHSIRSSQTCIGKRETHKYHKQQSNKVLPNNVSERTGTFFWVTKHTESLPRTPMEVIPAAFTALKAYSENPQTKPQTTKTIRQKQAERNTLQTEIQLNLNKRRVTIKPGRQCGGKKWTQRMRKKNNHIPTWYKRPSGEKIVIWRSYPAPDPLLMVLTLNFQEPYNSSNTQTHTPKIDRYTNTLSPSRVSPMSLPFFFFVSSGFFVPKGFWKP